MRAGGHGAGTRAAHILLGLGLAQAPAVHADPLRLLRPNGPTQQLVRWETEANAVVTQSSEAFPLEHIALPYDWLLARSRGVGTKPGNAEMLSPDMPPALREALVFENQGTRYVRWILRPGDKKYREELLEWLRGEGHVATPRSDYFTGYYTASRSLVVVGTNGAAFSAKVSTDSAPGNGSMALDKPVRPSLANSARLVDEYLATSLHDRRAEHFIVQREIGAFALKDEGRNRPAPLQAMVIRDLGPIATGDGDIFYLPGFSALHEKVGQEIAEMNGWADPAAFWREHYLHALGRALGELAGKYGVVYQSPHSQNFLIELKRMNGVLKPTGRIVLRDLTDTRLLDSVVGKSKAPIAHELLESYRPYGGVETDTMRVLVKPLQAFFDRRPRWLPREAAETLRWSHSFYDTFEPTFVAHYVTAEEQREPMLERMRATRKVGGETSYCVFDGFAP